MKSFIILFLFISLQCLGQDSLILLEKFPIKGQQFKLDILGNMYIVNGQALYKYNKSGQLQNTYSNKIWNSISSFDVSDPLKIMLFFNDFNRIVFLDNTLSIQSEAINLNTLLPNKPLLACTSYNNSFWLYEPLNNELFRYDNYLKLTQKSNAIKSLTNSEINPIFLSEINEKIYLCDSTQGIYIFDKFGGYLTAIPSKKIIAIQSINEQLIWLTSSNELHLYNPLSFQEKTIVLPLLNSKSFSIVHDILFLYNGETITKYKILEKK